MDDLPGKVAESLLRLVDTQRLSAHVVVDEADNVLRFGGHLAHYGLDDLSTERRAGEQLPFLEGMLPLVETPFLIRSLGMPSGRIADVHFFDDEGVVWVILLDMTAEHDETQRVQQKAYDMTLLSEREAKLIAQLEAANDQLTRAHRDLAASREALLVTHNRLMAELKEAERYVRAILPPPMTEPFAVDWLFVPTTELGGDSFGYHWIDDEHFAFYLLDVCGHGIGSALLSVAANQTLRSQALPGIDFRAPEAVLTSLNQVYQMDRHNDMYFTIWYGVYQRSTRTLHYATAGHPAPVVVHDGQAHSLPARGPALGMAPMARYVAQSSVIAPGSRLFLFSDGTFEIEASDGTMLDYDSFRDILARAPDDAVASLQYVLDFARKRRGSTMLEDDFSIMLLRL